MRACVRGGEREREREREREIIGTNLSDSQTGWIWYHRQNTKTVTHQWKPITSFQIIYSLLPYYKVVRSCSFIHSITHSFTHSLIPYFILRQVHCPFQKEFSTTRNLVLPLSISSVLVYFRSNGSFLRLLSRLPNTSFLPYIFSTVTRLEGSSCSYLSLILWGFLFQD